MIYEEFPDYSDFVDDIREKMIEFLLSLQKFAHGIGYMTDSVNDQIPLM